MQDNLALLRRIKEGDAEALEQLVSDNMGLVRHWIVTPIMMAVIILVLALMKRFYKNKPVKVKYVSKNIIKQ